MDEQNFSGAFAELEKTFTEFLAMLPNYAVALLVVMLAVVVARLTRAGMNRLLASQIRTDMLRRLSARLLGIFVFLLGCYVALRIANLTQLALTILGGTGLAGLVVGFAFRDIAENFLASIILAVQRPFGIGDVVEIEGHVGVVERMTIRCTVLMNFDGDHIQIPNASVFKSNIRNLITNPNQRESFVVGIGYDSDVVMVQQLALQVIAGNPRILKDPEPWVIVESLGAATVNLRVFFWVDISTYNMLKVKSSLMRTLLESLLEAGVDMPDEAREIIFPQGIDVSIRDRSPAQEKTSQDDDRKDHENAEGASDSRTESEKDAVAEGDFSSEKHDIQKQLRHSAPATDGTNLLG